MSDAPSLRESETPWWDQPPSPEPVNPTLEAFARTMCRTMSQANPDKLVGSPALPRWRSWLTLAEHAMQAAVSLGWTPPGNRNDGASPQDSEAP